MEDTTGPCGEVFKRFQSQCDGINKENFDLPDEADFQGIHHLREEAKETNSIPNYLVQLFHVMITESFWNFA